MQMRYGTRRYAKFSLLSQNVLPEHFQHHVGQVQSLQQGVKEIKAAHNVAHRRVKNITRRGAGTGNGRRKRIVMFAWLAIDSGKAAPRVG
jgi:hypothetical protein